MKLYKLVNTHPVARFYYKGSHSHPIRRTVLIIENTENMIRGYEVREGKIIRSTSNAPVKSYSKSKIARFNQLRGAGAKITFGQHLSKKSTLKRQRLFDFIFSGP